MKNGVMKNERLRIGRNIAEMRKEKKISQVKLAELSGVGHSHIARIELGKYNVGIDTLSKIVNVFGCYVGFLDLMK